MKQVVQDVKNFIHGYPWVFLLIVASEILELGYTLKNFIEGPSFIFDSMDLIFIGVLFLIHLFLFFFLILVFALIYKYLDKQIKYLEVRK